MSHTARGTERGAATGAADSTSGGAATGTVDSTSGGTVTGAAGGTFEDKQRFKGIQSLFSLTWMARTRWTRTT